MPVHTEKPLYLAYAISSSEAISLHLLTAILFSETK